MAKKVRISSSRFAQLSRRKSKAASKIMDFTYNLEILKNGIEVFDIQDPSTLSSMLIVVIKRGSTHDPVAYGGTYHYMEHILGSYFEYSRYGSNYDHLSMMNGSTVSTYLHIYKRFLYDESVLNSLIDNLCLFMSTPELDSHILENEKWMVNNETTSKLYDYPIMNIFFILEQLQTGRLSSTFGRIHSLNEHALAELKRTFRGSDYSIFLINIPSSSTHRQKKSLSNLKFRPVENVDKSLNSPTETYRIFGKNVLKINSTYNVSCMVFPRIEPAVLLYMQCTGNDIYEFTWENKPFVVQNYNDTLVIYTSDINSVSYSDDDLVRIYTQAFIQFLYKIYKAPVVENVLFFVHFYAALATNPIYNNLAKKMKMTKHISKIAYDDKLYDNYRKCVDTLGILDVLGEGTRHSSLIEKMDEFIEEFEPRFPSKIDFVLARMVNSSCIVPFDRYNEDTSMYYSFVPYEKYVNIDLHRLSFTMSSDLMLTINIDYASGIIYSNTLSYTNRTTYLCIELDMSMSSSSVGYGFFIFYFLSGCMPTLYTLYDDKKMILNCTYQSEKTIIESNLREVRYSDIFNLVSKLRSGHYDLMNSKNSFFYLVVTYLNKINMNKLYEKRDARIFTGRNTFKMHLMNYSKMVSTEIPVRMSRVISRNKVDIKAIIALKKDYILIYNECDDIILSQIFIQYIYALMYRLSRMRRIYMSNMRAGFDNNYYIILLNVQVKNIRNEMLRVYDMLQDKFAGVDFDVDVNSMLINVIKLMLYYNMSKFRSQFDMYSTEILREFIDLQMTKLRNDT